MRLIAYVLVALVAAVTLAVAAAPDSGAAPAPDNPAQLAFARLRALAGTWVGTAQHDGAAGEDTKVIYHVTAGGSAVLETVFPGTPHEMVTAYHLDGDKLVLTHYCAAGNQPTMAAKLPPSGDTLTFEFVRGTNMRPEDMHMHAARLVFVGPDRLEATWTSWSDGKPAGAAHFTLTRQK